jgi:hypothetical protein
VPLIVKTKGGRSYDQAAKSKWSLLHLRRAETFERLPLENTAERTSYRGRGELAHMKDQEIKAGIP